jgi:MscS family membrane protein
LLYCIPQTNNFKKAQSSLLYYHQYDLKRRGRNMDTNIKLIKCSFAICRFTLLTAILALAMTIVLSGLSFAQPTLKEVLKGHTDEEPVKDQTKTESKKPDIPLDELDRGTPRTSVKGFLKATRERDYERAAEYLDMRNLPKGMDRNNGPKMARQLKVVLDRTVWIDLDTLSPEPRGHADDGLPSYRDLICRIKTPEGEVDVLLQRVPRSDGVHIWKFASKTVVQIPQFYKHFGYGYLGEILPAAFFDIEFLGVRFWMWVSIAVLAVLAYFVALVVTVIFTFFLSRRKARPSYRLKRFIAGPIRLLIIALLLRAGINLLGPSVTMRSLLQAKPILIIIFAWTIIELFGFIFNRLADRFRRNDQHSASTVLLPVLRNVSTIIVITIAIIVLLDHIGFNVTTLLAGLGVGGIALALALQKSIENLIGTVTLYISKPVRVGDFCKFGEVLGTIEEIGLRSTRVRTLDHTVVSVPNAEFMNLHLNNFSKREKFWYHPRITLRYETTPDQIRYILSKIRKLLTSHPKVLSDPARVRFTNFGAYSLDLDIFAYIDATDLLKLRLESGERRSQILNRINSYIS